MSKTPAKTSPKPKIVVSVPSEVTTTDAAGNTITRYYTNGVLTGDSWTNVDGSYGRDAYNPDGTLQVGYAFYADGSSKQTNADGSYEITTHEGAGNDTTNYFNAQGVRTGSAWSNADGSYGRTQFNSDGSYLQYLFNADGTYSEVTDDGKGDITQENYTSAGGTHTSTNQVFADGTRTNTAYNADGTLQVSYTVYPDGSMKQVNGDGSTELTSTSEDGTSTTRYYDANGVLTGDAWTQADGSYGRDAYNPDGSLQASYAFNADGSPQSPAPTATARASASILVNDQVDALISAMSAFSVPGASGTVLPDNSQTAPHLQLAASLH